MISVRDLPAVDASLNALSTIFLTCGFIFILRKNVTWHKRCMISAFITSALFLVIYLSYHFYMSVVLHAAFTRFTNPAWFRPIYLAILIPHETLAIVIVPMILITLNRALRNRFDQHRKIARWTWPLWMYVSVTGVVIYLLLYKIFPQH